MGRTRYDALPVYRNEKCRICEDPYGHADLLLIESGKFLPMRKDPNIDVFHADWLRAHGDRPDDPAATIIHFDCYIHIAEEAQSAHWGTTPNACITCEQEFRASPYAFRLTVGKIGRDRTFEEDLEIPQRGYLCPECTSGIFSDDTEKGDVYERREFPYQRHG